VKSQILIKSQDNFYRVKSYKISPRHYFGRDSI